MILLLGGTKDSRDIAKRLREENKDFIYSTFSEYGSELLELDVKTLNSPLEEKDLKELIKNRKIDLIVDATHPYAQKISNTSMKIARELGAQYFRFERKKTEEFSEKTLEFDSSKEAAAFLKETTGNILLTTGSKDLADWNVVDKERITIRVLPTSEVLRKCEELGYRPYQIIAAQGPFSSEQNSLTLKEYDISYLVTKDSGDIGNTLEKIEAAKENNVTVILLKRPVLDYPKVTDKIEILLKWIKNV